MANTTGPTLESILKQLADKQAAEIAHAVRTYLGQLLGGTSTVAAAAPAARTVGRPAKAKATAPVAAAPVKKAAKGKRGATAGRRTSEQVTADNEKLLAFVKSQPNLRSEDIQKAIGMPKPNVFSGLQTLREAGKIKMVGIKRHARYSPA